MRFAALIASLTAAAWSSSVQAQTLNIDFGAHFPSTAASNTFGAAANKPGPWNNVATNSVASLLDVNGVTTAVSVTVTATTMDGWAGTVTTNIGLLRGDNFFGNTTTWAVALSGLHRGLYDVYVYSPTNGALSTGDFTLNGIAVANFKGSASETLTEGTDWKRVPAVWVQSDGLMTFTNTAALSYAGLAGLQIVEVQTEQELVQSTDLSVGDTHCPQGGVALQFGFDNGAGGGTAGNFVLESGEVLETHYVCNGANGANGSNGTSCTVTSNANGTATISCTDGSSHTVSNGTNGTNGTNGANGANGVAGANGTNGASGSSCSVVDNKDGTATISCTDGTTATVGQKRTGGCGATGTPGAGLALALLGALALRKPRRAS